MTHLIFVDGTDQGAALWVMVGADRRATARMVDGRTVHCYIVRSSRRGVMVRLP